MGAYDDIIRLPRPVSRRHAHMPNARRAKQFMPFAALRGYDDAIAAKEVRYDLRSTPSEEDRAAVDASLRGLAEALARGGRPRVTVEYFEAKPGDEGGRGLCRTLTGTLEKLVPELGLLQAGGRTFAFGDITGVWREDGDGTQG